MTAARGAATALASTRSDQASPLQWVEVIKAIAMLWIFLNHVVERVFGYPHFANPTSTWAPFEQRLAQFQPLEGYGAWDIPMTLLRYLGWSGDQGVQLFLIVSGFGLTWGLLARQQAGPLPLLPFYLRRAERIYPLWWGAHLLFIGVGLSFAGGKFIASFLGFRATPELMYFFSPAWWYVGLLLQLYLVYPLLWEGLRRWGPWTLLWTVCAVAFVIRGAGLMWFDGYLDAWSRGAFFITRLPEFVTGVSLAAWMHRAPEQTSAMLRSGHSVVAAGVAYVLGTALSVTLLGMAVAPYLVGVGAFVLLHAVLWRCDDRGSKAMRPMTWIGRHTYALFLVHHPVVALCMPPGASGVRALGGTLVAAVVTVVLAIFLEWSVSLATRWVTAWWRRGGLFGVAWRMGLIGVAASTLLVGSELAVRRFDPQEVAGWGERPALEIHPEFGWRLKPSQETRLRWEGYDYKVTANTLGFPGPEYPPDKPDGVLRIFAVGDAYTSAEGVDTPLAWPRLLEAQLNLANHARRAQVLNFAITGYGPEQTAAVIRRFAPHYHPDVIVYGFFVNEFSDALSSNEDFQRGIGFGQPSPDEWGSVFRALHLRRYLQLKARAPLVALARGQTEPQGYFLGNFQALEKGRSDMISTGRERVRQWLAQIRDVSDATGARVVIAMIPAPIQVCGRSQLGYYPRNVHLTDSHRFDLDQPQRLARAIAEPLGFEVLDLRDVLRADPENCPYRTDNMHFTEAGHRRVAEYLATRLLEYRWGN